MSSALQQRIVVRELARVFFEHHRHTFAYWECQAFRAAHEHLGGALKLERPLAHRAGENVEQSVVHLSTDLECLDAREYQVDELDRLVLRKFRRHRYVPATLVGEGRAFYGILLR